MQVLLTFTSVTYMGDDIMETSESRRRANAKYDREHTVSLTLKLNRETDADILDWLSYKKNRQGAIKRLIRLQIEWERQMKP